MLKDTKHTCDENIRRFKNRHEWPESFPKVMKVDI